MNIMICWHLKLVTAINMTHDEHPIVLRPFPLPRQPLALLPALTRRDLFDDHLWGGVLYRNLARSDLNLPRIDSVITTLTILTASYVVPKTILSSVPRDPDDSVAHSVNVARKPDFTNKHISCHNLDLLDHLSESS